jgi:branched-chain amino acid transport system permease protein
MVALDYNQVGPFMGFMPGLKAFIAAVVGGIGSIPGALLGGLLLGVVETLAIAIGLSAFKDAFAFILLILILLFKPSGLLLKSIKEKV